MKDNSLFRRNTAQAPTSTPSSHSGSSIGSIGSIGSIDDGWILCPKLDALLSRRKPLGQRTPGQLVINVASVEELCKLPRLGRKRAEGIVRHRESHGPFADFEDLNAISGIGRRIIDGLIGSHSQREQTSTF